MASSFAPQAKEWRRRSEPPKPDGSYAAAASAFARAESSKRERLYVDMRSKAAARASRSLETIGSDMPDVRHPRLVSVLLPELSIDPVAEIHTFVREEFAAGRRGVVDGDGLPVVWPWERAAAPSSSKRPLDSLDTFINEGLDAATKDGHRGRFSTGVRAWFSFHEDERSSPHRPMDPNSPIMARLQEEWLAMRYVCALVQERGVMVTTAAQYFSQVQGWHAREHGVKLAGGLKLERLPQMLKGLRRIMGDTAPTVRRGLAPQALRAAMDACLDPSIPEHANLRAAIATAFQGLLRGEEFATDTPTKWRAPDRLTRDDIKELTAERAVIMMHPCKNMHHLKGKTVPLVIGAGGHFIDAVAEIHNMLRVDPARGNDPALTPLFRNPITGLCITKEGVHQLVKQLMAAVGENPDHFGTHSMRIGGATALFAAGADPTVIRTMGRWSSDIYRLYVRACFERCCSWTARAGSATVTDVVVEFDEVDSY